MPTLPARPFRYNPEAQLTLDDVPLQDLAAQFGTPLYVYSAEQISSRFALFRDAFAAVPHLICYAVKANSALAILQLLGAAGAGFDIVSGGELERVRRACPPALNRVVFSGVGKQAWEIDAALDANILLFNVESPTEIDLLAARAAARGIRARFALRVNPDVLAETHPYISTGLREHKFGIALAEARALYRAAARHPSLQAVGVSVHIGSQIRAVAPFAEALTRVASLVRDLREDGHAITHIDAGGGLGIDYTAPLATAQQSPRTTDTATSREAPIAEVAGNDLVAEDSSPESKVTRYAHSLLPIVESTGCTLVLEPGRFLVAPAGGLLTSVLAEKRNGAKRFVVTDAAMNDLIRPALYQAHHEILPVRSGLASASLQPIGRISKSNGDRPAAQSAPADCGEERHIFGNYPADIVGPVCESGDFFAQDRALPPTQAGDLLLIADAGAYGMSQSSNYNSRVRPAEVLVVDGKPRLIRRRETIDDLLAPEQTL